MKTIFTQTKVWEDKNTNDNSNESFNLTSKDGGSFRVDIGINFKIKNGESPKVFEKWRSDINTVADVHFKRLIQDALTRESSTYSAFELMSKRTEILTNAETKVRQYLLPLGIDVEQVYLINIYPPASISEAMNAKMAAEEKAAKVAIELKEAEANAAILKVQSEAESLAIRSKGLALQEYPNVLELEKIKKWDGQLPSVVGSNSVMFDVSKFTEQKN